MSNKKIKIVELFGGVGAPRAALENLLSSYGIEVKSIDYCEMLPYAVMAYNRMFDNNYKPQDVLNWNLKVDMLVHGSPCVDFSKANNNDKKSGLSMLYLRTLEIIEKELNPRPPVVVWENVKGLLSKKNISHFNHYLNTMENLGYLNYYDVLNSKDFGIPQNRERVFTISIRNDIKFKFDFNKLERKPMKPLIEFLEKNPQEIVDYDIYQPSMQRSIENGQTRITLTYVNTITTRQSRWNNAGVVFKDYTNFYTYPRASDGKLINGAHNRAWKTDKYVGCIPASKIPQIAKLENNHLLFRYLTQRECFRLMGFTDQQFDKILLEKIPPSTLYKLAGNSIVVPVLEEIFKQILDGVFNIKLLEN